MDLTKIIADLFVDEPVVAVPTVDIRYRYKKVGGSSDTKHTQDVFN